jgi:hypothetical protein
MQTSPLLRGLLLAVLVAGSGCSRPADEDRFRFLVARVRDGDSDTIDGARTPKISDQALQAIVGLGGLRHLVLDGCPITDAGLVHVGQVPELESLSLSETHITDQGLAVLTRLPRLRFLRLDRVDVTDEGLEWVGQIRSLQYVSLWQARITGNGVKHLSELPELCLLSLDSTPIGDSDLAPLRRVPTLGYLSVWQTKVSAEAGREMETALPNLHVHR